MNVKRIHSFIKIFWYGDVKGLRQKLVGKERQGEREKNTYSKRKNALNEKARENDIKRESEI